MEDGKICVALCAARHPMPAEVEGSIFPSEVNPLDLEGQWRTVYDFLNRHADALYIGNGELVVYATGLTVALVTVINACCINGVRLTLMHYNRETGTYYPQQVNTREYLEG